MMVRCEADKEEGRITPRKSGMGSGPRVFALRVTEAHCERLNYLVLLHQRSVRLLTFEADIAVVGGDLAGG